MSRRLVAVIFWRHEGGLVPVGGSKWRELVLDWRGKSLPMISCVQRKSDLFMPVLLFSILLLCSCDKEDERRSGVVAIDPPDMGEVEVFLSCKARPKRALSEKEECMIQKLSARCLPADDCMVSCIASPDGYKVGGGCEHVCFSALHDRVEPPSGWGDCEHGESK